MKKEAQKVMPGTCEACVYGRGKHAETCEHWLVMMLRAAEWPGALRNVPIKYNVRILS